jgi:hypothetical protein
MRKVYTTIVLAMMAMMAFAQETNDTVYVMFDFNLNPWNHPTSEKSSKGWGPNYDDETGAILKETDFTWPLTEGSDKLVTVTIYPIDWDEYDKPAILVKGENYDVQTQDGKDSIMTVLFTNPGTKMRFKAPEGYKFGKMMFFEYRSTYYVLDTEESIEVERLGSMHTDTHKIWIPETPKTNQYGEECWQGDETDILFDCPNFKGNFMKIDMRLVPDGTASTIIKGDANSDGTVNAADIVEVVNYIMGNPSAKFNQEAADANGDGTVNAADIVTIVNIIMGQ